jgi:6-phosphofructokinase 1
MAADLAVSGTFGRLVALKDGIYTNVPLSETGSGVKRVDVDALYDSENYRPLVRKVEGMPMFLS